jgi:hypothetical protein
VLPQNACVPACFGLTGHVLGCRYDIYSFSKPGHPLCFVTYPLVIALQSKFADDSARAVAQVAARFTAGKTEAGTCGRCD